MTGDYCYGPRYWVALLPALAICAVTFAGAHGRLLRGVLASLALAAAAFAISGALEYPWMFDQPAWLALGAFF